MNSFPGWFMICGLWGMLVLSRSWWGYAFNRPNRQAQSSMKTFTGFSSSPRKKAFYRWNICVYIYIYSYLHEMGYVFSMSFFWIRSTIKRLVGFWQLVAFLENRYIQKSQNIGEVVLWQEDRLPVWIRGDRIIPIWKGSHNRKGAKGPISR